LNGDLSMSYTEVVRQIEREKWVRTWRDAGITERLLKTASTEREVKEILLEEVTRQNLSSEEEKCAFIESVTKGVISRLNEMAKKR